MTDVLFEEGDWRISRTGFGDGSVIMHRCGDEYSLGDRWWHISDAEDRCVFCQIAVPAEIYGLLLLHQWER